MTAQPQGYRSPYSPEGFDKTRGDLHSDDDAFEEAERGSPTRLDVELDPRQFPSLDAARASTPKRHLRAVPVLPTPAMPGDACDTDDESSSPGSGGGGGVTHTVVSVSTTKNPGAWAKPPPLVRAPELSDRAPAPAADVTTPTRADDAVDRWPKPAVASRGSLASPGGTREESAGNEEAAADPPPDTPAATPTNHPPAPRAKPPAPKDDQPSPSPAPERASSSHSRRSRGGSRRKRRDVSPTVPASPPADAAVTPATATPPEKKTNDGDGGKERPGPAGPHHAGSDSDDAIDHPATPEAVLVAKAEVAIVDGKSSAPSSPVKVVDVSVSTTVSAPTTAGDDVSREDPSTIATVDESTTREEEDEVDEEELMGAEGAEGVPRSPGKPLDASFEFGDPAASPAGPTPENLSGGTVTAVAVEAAAELAAAEAKAAIVPSTALVPDASAGTFRGAGESLAVAPPSPKHGITITPFDAERQQREIYVPNVKVGLVIGKGGSHVVYFQHQSGAAIHIARDQGEIPGGVNYVVPPCAYADQCESAVTGDGMRRITLLGGEHQTMMAADMIRRLVESSAERCDRTTERQHAIESGHGLPPLPPANSSLSEPPMNNSAGYGSTPGTNPYAAPVTRYNPGDPYGQMPGAQQTQAGAYPSPFANHGWGRDAASHVEVAATVSIPHRKVGLIIGRGGENIRFLQQQTRAHIQIQSEHDMCPGQPERTVYLRGARESCAEAARMIQDLVDGMFRIGTAAVVPPQPPVPSDGYHSGYSSGNERADPRTSAGSYSFAPPTAADPQWQHHVANAGGIVGYASSGSLGSGTNEPPLGAVNGANGRPGGMPPVAAAAAAAAAQAAAIGSAYRGGPDAGAWFPGGTDPGYPYADRRMGAGAGVVPTPAYPTAYPVAATPPPVVPSYDYNVAAYGPMGGAGVNPGVAAAVGGNPYAASPDPYLAPDPNGPYNAAAAAAYFANVPTHTAHAQIRAMGYADPVSTMQYWQQCLDYFSRSAAMSGYQPYAPAPAAPVGVGGAYGGVAAPPPVAFAASTAPTAPTPVAAADPPPTRAESPALKSEGAGDSEATRVVVNGGGGNGGVATEDGASATGSPEKDADASSGVSGNGAR